MDTNACRLFALSVAQAFDGATDNNTRVLEPGVLARGDFLHWAWQIKFEAAKNVAHVVDKMLHACGGSGYKRDMELERYLRDAKAGWVMGPTNEVLRQFVGKAVLLGFESLDYWNQTYNRRAVENEVKKLDAAGQARARRAAARRGGRSRRRRSPPKRVGSMATAARPRLLVPGLAPARPGARDATACARAADDGRRAARPDDRLTVRDVQGGAARRCSTRGRVRRTRADLFGAGVAGRAPSESRSRADRETRDRSTVARARRASRSSRAASRRPTCSSRSSARRPRATSSSRRSRSRSPSRGSTSRSPRASALAYEVKAGEYIQVIDVQGPPVLRLPRLPRGQAAGGQGARPRLDDDALADGERLPHARALRRSSTTRTRSARRGRARHGRPPRHLRPRVQREVLRGHGLLRARQLLRQLQRASCCRTRSSRARAGRRSTSSSTPRSTRTNLLRQRRAVVAARRLRAAARRTTDLVCLSSACPDDIDPANAWNPTEVHVRVYPAKERFSAAIAHRVTPDAEPKLTQETGFHPRTCALTSRFTEYNGYWLPTAYDNLGAVAEYWACREQRGDDGSLAAPQVGDARARRRGAAAGDDDARHPPARRRPGRLHGDLQRHRRHDRRRHRLPARARTTSASSAAPSTTASGCASRPSGSGCACGSRSRPTSCTTSPCRARPAATCWRRSSGRAPTQTPFAELKWFRFSVGAARRAAGAAADRLAHRLLRRARLRALLPPEGRARRSGTR